MPLWEIRKPTPDERLSIIANWIRMHGKEGPIAQETFHLYEERSCSIKSIVGKFAREGKTRNDGRAITHCCLEKVLASEKYIGVLKCESARNENAMPPLVSKELFNLCQKKRTKRKHKNFKLKEKEEYYLSGKVYSSFCGEQYLEESATGHSGRFYTNYKCHRAKRHTCKARAIKKDILETIVLFVLLKLLSDDETGRYIVNCIYSEQKKGAPEITSMKKRRSEVEKKIGNFVKAIGMEIVTNPRSRHCFPLNPREAGWTRSFPNYLLIPKASRRMKSDGP